MEVQIQGFQRNILIPSKLPKGIKLNKPNEVNYNGKIIYHNYNVLVSKYDDRYNNSFDINKVV